MGRGGGGGGGGELAASHTILFCKIVYILVYEFTSSVKIKKRITNIKILIYLSSILAKYSNTVNSLMSALGVN